MPLRSESLCRRWSVLDLPILPFLAPRVFRPWPYRTKARRSHTACQPVQRDEGFNETIPESANPYGKGHWNENAISRIPKEDRNIYLPGKIPASTPPEPSYLSDSPALVYAKRNVPARWIRTPIRELKKDNSEDESLRFFQHRLMQKQTLSLTRPSYQRYGPRTPAPTIRTFENEYYSEHNTSSIPIQLLFTRPQAYVKFVSTEGIDMEVSLIPWLIEEDTSTSVYEKWRTIPEDTRSSLWPKVMATTLRNYPHKALKVLAGTYVEPYPPALALSEALDYIVWHYLADVKPSSDGLGLYLFDIITRLLRNGPTDYVYLQQTAIYHLLVHMPTVHDVIKLYRTLQTINNPLMPPTLAHFASRIAKAGQEFDDIAFEIFQKLGDMNLDMNTRQMQSICTTILSCTSKDAKVGYLEKFEYMLKCGLTPNTIVYNVLILKMLQNNNTDGAWRVYEMMSNSAPNPDAYTYSALLNDAKLKMDTARMAKLVQTVKDKSIQSSYIVTDSLHAMLLLDKQAIHQERRSVAYSNSRSRNKDSLSFETILSIYCKYFSFDLLAHLIPRFAELYPQFTISEVPTNGEVNIFSSQFIHPTTATLIVMISAFFHTHKDPQTPKLFYDHWRKLVQAGDPAVAKISKSREGADHTHVFNLILVALSRHADNLPSCLHILGEMSRGSYSQTMAEQMEKHTPESTPLRPPKPDVTTWNIFAKIFMTHHQPRAAEKILGMMKERDIPANDITFNTLIMGYARMQNPDMVIDTVDRKERAGWKHNSYTFSALRHIEDQSRLVEGLRQRQMERYESELLERESEDKKEGRVNDLEVEEELEEVELVVRDMLPKSLSGSLELPKPPELPSDDVETT